MSEQLVIAVDGGNSKTDLALIGGDGSVLGLVRGTGSSPHHIGRAGSIELIDDLLDRAFEQAAIDARRADVAVLHVAGADLDSEERELRLAAGQRGWAEVLVLGNDTLAVLRSGSDAGFGIAVVCGAGINAFARSPSGREVRFPALGPITGDWGGGADLGLAALGQAVRSEDGRGQPTALSTLVAAHFALGSAEEVALAVHRQELDFGRLVELAPVVLEAADSGDEQAIGLRRRLADEIVTFAAAAAGRALEDVEHYDVVLGGSLLAGSVSLGELVAAQLHTALPAAEPKICRSPPVLGSALVGLDLLGSDPESYSRLRGAFEQMLAPVVLQSGFKEAEA